MIDMKEMLVHFEGMSAHQVLEHMVQVAGLDAVFSSLVEIIQDQYVEKASYVHQGGIIFVADGKTLALNREGMHELLKEEPHGRQET